MTAIQWMQSIFEIICIILLLFGFAHEDQIAAVERFLFQTIKATLKGRYKHEQ